MIFHSALCIHAWGTNTLGLRSIWDNITVWFLKLYMKLLKLLFYSLSRGILDFAHIITWQNNNIMKLFMKLSDIHLFSKYFRVPLHVKHYPRHGDELKCQSQTCYTFSQNLNCVRYSEDPSVPMTSSVWVEIVFGLNQ